ncbi:calcineurin-like phosphoesterase C-terminal domain-containing protein [Georgenia sp. SYP-B2076]|uniref:calcineurin-like phosphoesterase C-terminal domain-containing protein n=1 Tax=Georgenia sp. SYP-B2076 TaxID=2495881 RepID=UPI000F8C376A|nr:calcineurin-like phosphoesterase C-terminal domain-containing protein [Georgenia sp. SYP-B2076]
MLRRRLTLTCTVLAAGLLVPGTAASAVATTETAEGVVYNDHNGNGRRDAGEPGIEGVAVSNGLDVVTTDQGGAYSLPVDEETILFVSKPSGYMVPVNEVQLPQFYYLHYPNGTPHTLRYGGIEPTGPLPESVDFPLVEQDDPDAFDALVFADPQTRNSGEIGELRQDVIAELVGSDAAFGLTVGDVVNDPLSLIPEHNAAVAEIGIPWWSLPGNHDMDYDAPSDEHATDTFKSVFGPTNYSFDYGQVHVVAMDNVEKTGTGSAYRGSLSEQQLQWLANDLAQVPDDALVVIATHIPLKSDASTSAGGNTANLEGLFDVLADRENVYSFSGHDTSNSWQMYLGEEDGWTGAKPFHQQVLAEVRGGGWTTGPIDERGVSAADMADGNPNGYYTMSFDGTDYTARYKAASLPADFQMRLSFSGGEGDVTRVPSGPSGSGDFAEAVQYHPRDWNGERWAIPTVTANVFDGGARHTVEVSIDGRPFAAMTRSAPVDDPYMTTLRAAYLGTPEQPAKPEPSSHLWTAGLPNNIAPGQHTVTVRSTDPYGQVSESTTQFQVVAGKPASR